MTPMEPNNSAIWSTVTSWDSCVMYTALSRVLLVIPPPSEEREREGGGDSKATAITHSLKLSMLACCLTLIHKTAQDVQWGIPPLLPSPQRTNTHHTNGESMCITFTESNCKFYFAEPYSYRGLYHNFFLFFFCSSDLKNTTTKILPRQDKVTHLFFTC